MSEVLKLQIEPPKKGGANIWGTFIHSPAMPWGPWHLTSEPKEIFRIGDMRILECCADEYVQGSDGFVPERTLENDPCHRHFLIGQKIDGVVIWWHSLMQEYDLKNHRFAEASITLKEKQVIVKGYGGYGPEEGKTICIDIDTGAKSEM